MYYSLPPFRDGREDDGWRIGIAASTDLDTWQRIGEIPPLSPCDRNGLCAPGAIVLNSHVHLFYQTYGNQANDAICHAVSADGLGFLPNRTNPIFAPTGAWICGRAIDADVIAHDGRLFLYFSTRDPDMHIQMTGVATASSLQTSHATPGPSDAMHQSSLQSFRGRVSASRHLRSADTTGSSTCFMLARTITGRNRLGAPSASTVSDGRGRR